MVLAQPAVLLGDDQAEEAVLGQDLEVAARVEQLVVGALGVRAHLLLAEPDQRLAQLLLAFGQDPVRVPVVVQTPESSSPHILSAMALLSRPPAHPARPFEQIRPDGILSHPLGEVKRRRPSRVNDLGGIYACPMDLSVVFYGTGGSVPTARRATACVLIRAGGKRVLVDCGEGAQRQMMRSTGLVQVDEILITHLHADHYLGLPGLLKTYDLQDRQAPLRIAGPPGLKGLFDGAPSDLRQDPLRGRSGRAARGRGTRARRRGLRDALLRGRAPDAGQRLRLRRSRASRPLRRRRRPASWG